MAGACGGSSAATPGSWTPPDPGHHQPTPPVEGPAATPYDSVTYEDPGSNPFVDPNKDRASTFGLDVDTASYTVARRYIADGNLPDPSSVRLEEFVNFFDQGYPLPEDETFAIHVDGGPSPFVAATRRCSGSASRPATSPTARGPMPRCHSSSTSRAR